MTHTSAKDEPLLACEEWRPIPGYNGYYEVSSFGRVRSWYTGGGYRLKEPRLKKIQRDKDGYPFVLLYKTREFRGFRVSRLVLCAFVGAPDKDREASHVDGDKQNNLLGNLQWETRLENEQRKDAHGTRPRGEGNTSSKVTSAQVMAIRKLRESGATLKVLAKKYGITESATSRICRRETWAHVE